MLFKWNFRKIVCCTDVNYNFCNHKLYPSLFFSYLHVWCITCMLILVVLICIKYQVYPKLPVLQDHAFYLCSLLSAADHALSSWNPAGHTFFQLNIFIKCSGENSKSISKAHLIINKNVITLLVGVWKCCLIVTYLETSLDRFFCHIHILSFKTSSFEFDYACINTLMLSYIGGFIWPLYVLLSHQELVLFHEICLVRKQKYISI